MLDLLFSAGVFQNGVAQVRADCVPCSFLLPIPLRMAGALQGSKDAWQARAIDSMLCKERTVHAFGVLQKRPYGSLEPTGSKKVTLTWERSVILEALLKTSKSSFWEAVVVLGPYVEIMPIGL